MNKEQELIYNNLISKYNFNELQNEQILLGVELGFDVSIYAKPEYNSQQMAEIRNSLENNIDVTLYLNPNIK